LKASKAKNRISPDRAKAVRHSSASVPTAADLFARLTPELRLAGQLESQQGQKPHFT
jgi:hypothetical protein